MSEKKFTPGPWFSDKKGLVWRHKPTELYENGGGIAGDQPIASVNVGWNEDGQIGYPVDSNAHFIAAAPDMYDALEEIAEMKIPYCDADYIAHCMRDAARAALHKARGEE